MPYKKIVHINPFGRTAEKVSIAISEIVFSYNFNNPDGKYDPLWSQVEQQCKEICAQAEKSSRKGMMINSSFRVENKGNSIEIIHVRNTNEDRVFITILK
jgi:hypothetical protein